MTSKIDKLMGSKTRVTLLSKLMMDPHRRYYIRELSKLLNIPYGMLYREVKNLVSLGIITEEKKGKITLLSANMDLPYFAELRGLMIKTAGLGDAMRDALSGFAGIRYALIYGSFASGEETERSDVDLLTVGDIDEEDLLKALSGVEKDVGREVNYILWSVEEFMKRAREGHHLLADVSRKPVLMLDGDEDEFRRTIEKEDYTEN